MQSGGEEGLNIIVDKLNKTSENGNFFYIYKVYDHLRNLNKKAYEPVILAIGPYHHNAPNTRLMEKHKVFYLKSLLQRKNENVKTYFSAVEKMEREARECYAHHITLGSTDFINMMLLDGCFIIELLEKFAAKFLEENDDNRYVTDRDDIFDIYWMLGSIRRDLMLFENQIPFFVLQTLFNLVEHPNHTHSISKLLFEFFKDIIPDQVGYKERNIENTFPFHLLHLIHLFWYPSGSSTSQGTITKGVKFIASATKLRDANVKFEKKGAEDKFEKNDNPEDSLFDVKFESGTLKMTPLQIDDNTEALFRNLIAYEQYFRGPRDFVTDYVTFLDCLIDSPEDVEILREQEILHNCLGNDTVVSDIFNKLTDSIFMSNNFSYIEVFDQLNERCKKSRNKWMATLRRNHLSSPWAILSIIAAVILLLLTTVQTVCSILQV